MNTGAGCQALLQGIFLTQGWNPHHLCLLHCRRVFYRCTTWEATVPKETGQSPAVTRGAGGDPGLLRCLSGRARGPSGLRASGSCPFSQSGPVMAADLSPKARGMQEGAAHSPLPSSCGTQDPRVARGWLEQQQSDPARVFITTGSVGRALPGLEGAGKSIHFTGQLHFPWTCFPHTQQSRPPAGSERLGRRASRRRRHLCRVLNGGEAGVCRQVCVHMCLRVWERAEHTQYAGRTGRWCAAEPGLHARRF